MPGPEPVAEQASLPAQMPAEVHIDPEFAETAAETPIPDFLDVQPTGAELGESTESIEPQFGPEAAPVETETTPAPEGKPVASRPVFRRGRAKQATAPAQPTLKLQTSKARRRPQPRLKPAAETQRSGPARRIITRQATRRTTAPATPPVTPSPAPERTSSVAASTKNPTGRVLPRRIVRPAAPRPKAIPRPQAATSPQPVKDDDTSQPKRQLPARQVQRKPVQRQAVRKAVNRRPAPRIQPSGSTTDAGTPGRPSPAAEKPHNEDG